jgi:uncharacterized oligopeptide transporter (OPT) family protein
MADAPSGSGSSGGPVEPYISASKTLPELTLGALTLGAILAVVLAGANAYLGMFAGMTVSASVPAAVISMGIFRAIRRGNILQNNGVQTAAASGEGLAAGVIFTFPALVILKEWSGFNYIETTLIAGFGGILGVLFTIPLRRALIIDQPLQFPEGVATAEVLKVGAEGGGGVGVLLLTGLLGATIKLGAAGLKLWGEVAEFATTIGATAAPGAAASKTGVPAYFGINASPALLSVGYIVGFNVALVIFLGAVLNRWVAMPIYAAVGDPGAIVTDLTIHTQAMEVAKLYPAYVDAQGAALVGTVREMLFDTSWVNPQLVDPFGLMDQRELSLALRANAQTMPLESIDSIALSGTYHGKVTRFLGVGGMLVGGMWSLFKLRKSLLGGIKAGLDAYKRARQGGDNTVLRTERDMPMNIILILIVASLVPLFFIFWHVAGSPFIAAVMAVVMLIAGFLFSAVASYMAGLVGSSNNPVSGITVSTILVSALLLLALGADEARGPIAAILIGSVVCCAAAIGGDNLQDLKCGQLVGSTPWKQQVMQILGVVAAAFVMAPILNLLNDSYGIGEATPDHPKPLNAPQATLMGSVANGVFKGGLPITVIGVGAAIAVGIIIIDSVLASRQAKFRVPVMAFAVGVYLPFDLNVPIMLGGIVALIVQKHLDRTSASPARRAEVERMGLLAAAGFITGEALMGIGIAVPTAALATSENKAPLALFGGHYEELKFPALIFVAVSLWLLYKLALRPSTPAPKR